MPPPVADTRKARSDVFTLAAQEEEEEESGSGGGSESGGSSAGEESEGSEGRDSSGGGNGSSKPLRKTITNKATLQVSGQQAQDTVNFSPCVSFLLVRRGRRKTPMAMVQLAGQQQTSPGACPMHSTAAP